MKNLMIFVSLVSMFAACGGGAGTNGRSKMDNGFEYTMYTNASDKANVSDWVEFDLDLIDPATGKVIQSMRDPLNRPLVQIPDPATAPKEQLNNPIISLAGIMGVGDSATVYIPMDSVPTPTPEMAGMEEIAYTLVATQVLDNEERASMMAAKQAEQQKLQSAGAEVAVKKGEEALAIYGDFNPLTARDVAETIYFMASQPAHVNIQDIVMFGTQQANGNYINRSGRLYD